MGAERQQGRPYQRLLFPEWKEGLRHDDSGEGGTGPGTFEEEQTPTALDPARASTERLMEEVCQLDNLNQAYRRVKANKGAPGVDGMTIDELPTATCARPCLFEMRVRPSQPVCGGRLQTTLSGLGQEPWS